MGLLDSLVTSAVTSALGGNADTLTGNLVKGVAGMMAGNTGGLSGLVNKFTQSGLGYVAASWIGKGENKPVSPAQLTALFINRYQQQAQFNIKHALEQLCPR